MAEPYEHPSFTPDDDRLREVICGLCGDAVRLVKYAKHSWGEFIVAQCDSCGAMMDICTNTEHMRWEELKSATKDETVPSLKRCMDENWAARNPAKVEVVVDEDTGKAQCCECDEEFTPRKSCVAVREYCQKCRKDIPEDDDRWLTEKQIESREKKAARAAAKAKPKRVKRKTT